MMSTTPRPPRRGRIEQLFESRNFRDGGIGRLDASFVAEIASEAALVARAAQENAYVVRIGTDYVVFKRGTEVKVLHSPIEQEI